MTDLIDFNEYFMRFVLVPPVLISDRDEGTPYGKGRAGVPFNSGPCEWPGNLAPGLAAWVGTQNPNSECTVSH